MNIRSFRKMLKTYVSGKVDIWDQNYEKKLGEYSSIEEFIFADTLEFDVRKMVYANLYFEDEDNIEHTIENIPRIIKSLVLEISISDIIETEDAIDTIEDVMGLVEPVLIFDIDDPLCNSLTSGQCLNKKFGGGDECEFLKERVSSIYISIGSLAKFEHLWRRNPAWSFNEWGRLIAFELSSL